MHKPVQHQDSPKKVVVGTLVWGDHHTRVFLDYALPCYLAPGNIPYLIENYETTYVIATDRITAKKIKKNKMIKKLSDLINVKFMFFDETNVKSKWTLVRRSNELILQEAAKQNAVVITAGPDSTHSNCCFKHAMETIELGYRVYLLAGYRTILERMTSAFDSEFRTDLESSVIDIDASSLTKLGIKNMHQGMSSWFWNREDFSCLGTYLSFDVANQGVLGFCYNAHPLAIWPEKYIPKITKIFDQDYMVESCPDLTTHFVEQNSTRSVFFEMSLEKENQHQRGASATSKLFRMAMRFEHFDPVVRGFCPKYPVRFPVSEIDEKLWSSHEQKGRMIVRAVDCLNRLPDWVIALINPPQLFMRQKMRKQPVSEGFMIKSWTKFLFRISATVKAMR